MAQGHWRITGVSLRESLNLWLSLLSDNWLPGKFVAKETFPSPSGYTASFPQGTQAFTRQKISSSNFCFSPFLLPSPAIFLSEWRGGQSLDLIRETDQSREQYFASCTTRKKKNTVTEGPCTLAKCLWQCLSGAPGSPLVGEGLWAIWLDMCPLRGFPGAASGK